MTLAAWDARRADWFDDRLEARRDWLVAQDVPVMSTYRVEFLILDCPVARVFTYHMNELGQRHYTPAHTQGLHDHTQCAAEVNEPYMHPLSDLPPADLLG